MPLSPGQRLAGYEIADLVGAGGMGEVYRARDVRLNRDVALKILPARMASDPLAFARFEREAQAVAALSHPNILAVHDFGHSDGSSFVVFELLEGATLRERLQQGPLPLRKAIDYARQIADGLGAAHGKGITHRDIKPDNVFVTTDGRVKILDFGLAQMMTPGLRDDDPTIAQSPSTEAGTLLGTVGYMAPEQVRGQAVDYRADLFALGCVLYEMCTGARAFKGATPADTMTAVLSSDAPELTLPGMTAPPALDRILRRCLEKLPGERFQSARDLSFALDALTSVSASARDVPGAAVPSARRTWVPATVAAALALGVGLVAARVLWPASSPVDAAPAPRLRAEFQSVLGNNRSLLMALSPDGRYLLYSDAGRRALLLRDLGTGELTPVPDGAGGMSVGWSPRSDGVLFYTEQRELRRFRLGEKSTTQVVAIAEQFRGASWLADDTVVYLSNGASPVRRVAIAGGPSTEVVHDETHSFTGPSSIGQRADYVLALRATTGQSGLARERRVPSETSGGNRRYAVAIRLADGHVTEIVPADAEPAWASGHLLLPRAAGIFALPFDDQRLVAVGEPLSLGESILWDPGTATSSLAVSKAGLIAFRPGQNRALQFEWLDLTGKSLGRAGPSALYGSFALSPDGKRVIARQVGSFGAAPSSTGIVLIDLERGVTSPVSVPEGAVSDPIWTADGTRILYRLGSGVLRQSPYANTPETLLRESIYPDALSADGRWFIGGAARRDGGYGLLVMSADDPTKRQLLSDDRSTADEGSFSPDGALISFHSNRTGRQEIYLARFPLTDDRWQVSSEGGVQPRWSADGRTLYYLGLDGRLMRVSISPGQPDRVGRSEPMFQMPIDTPSVTLEQYAVHGDRLLVLRAASDSLPQTIAVISNWTQGLPTTVQK